MQVKPNRLHVPSVLLLLAAAVAPAVAADTTIGGVAVALPPPAGFCELSEAEPSDHEMVVVMSGLIEKTGNKLLGLSADCQQLADWRSGRRALLDDYAQFQTPSAQIDQLITSPQASIQQVCSALREQGSRILANVVGDVKTNIEAALKNVKMNEASFVGVLAEDDTACYSAQVQKMQAQNGTDKTQIGLVAITVVKRKFVFVDRMSVYVDADATSALLAKVQATVAALYAANN